MNAKDTKISLKALIGIFSQFDKYKLIIDLSEKLQLTLKIVSGTYQGFCDYSLKTNKITNITDFWWELLTDELRPLLRSKKEKTLEEAYGII